MKQICNLDNINKKIKEQKMNLLIVCYGGCCSNHLVSILEKKNKYKIICEIYRKILCHCPEYIETDIPIIYLYDNPIKSFLSMKERGNGIYDVNQKKLSNNIDIEISDENLLKLMIKQFNNWTKIKRKNVLIVKTSELFKPSIVNKLESFLNKKLKGFPIEYKIPYIKPELIQKKYMENPLFIKYKSEIDQINNFTI